MMLQMNWPTGNLSKDFLSQEQVGTRPKSEIERKIVFECSVFDMVARTY